MAKYFEVRSFYGIESCTSEGLVNAFKRCCVARPNQVVYYEVRPLKADGKLYKRADELMVMVDCMAVESGDAHFFNALVIGDSSVSRVIVGALAGKCDSLNIL